MGRRFHQRTRLAAIVSFLLQLTLFACRSSLSVDRQVFFGRPPFLLPSAGVHSIARRAGRSGAIRMIFRQTGISFPLRCQAVVSVQYVPVFLRLIPCLSMWLQWFFSSFVDEIHLACSVSSSCFSMFHWHIWLSTQLQMYITAVWYSGQGSQISICCWVNSLTLFGEYYLRHHWCKERCQRSIFPFVEGQYAVVWRRVTRMSWHSYLHKSFWNSRPRSVRIHWGTPSFRTTSATKALATLMADLLRRGTSRTNRLNTSQAVKMWIHPCELTWGAVKSTWRTSMGAQQT